MHYVNGRPLFLIFVSEIRNFKMTIEQKKKKTYILQESSPL